ncbi:hypothetical protein FO519_008827, partial [Halicephalobus sp. NKZ332]
DTDQSNSEAGKSFTPDELKLRVLKAIYDNETVDSVISGLGENVGEDIRRFIHHHFGIELLKFVKAGIKELMKTEIIAGETKFIDSCKENLSLKKSDFSHWTERLVNNNIKLEDNRLIPWREDFTKYFHFLLNRFVSSGPEETIKLLMIEWLELGEMSLEVWGQWCEWFKNGAHLSTLKTIKWAKSSCNDVIKPKFIETLAKISTDEFSDAENLKALLALYLKDPEIEKETKGAINDDTKAAKTETVNVIGRTIFLSLVVKDLESSIKETDAEEVNIIAANVLHINCSLDSEIWQGRNLAIVADRVNVWGKQVINVSGKGYKNSELRERAQDGGSGEDGKDGDDGKAGESSGGVAIVTPEMANAEKLTIILSGGDGQDGQDGGNGGDGIDGKGVTEEELLNTCLPYSSLYRDYWSNFQGYSPEGWERKEEQCMEGDFIFHVYEDKYGRKMYYTYSCYYGWYSWYELVLWIKGGNATAGGSGGLNGRGGEGGNQGECTVINPDTGLSHDVRKIQNNGKNGKDGKVGSCGKLGQNGNDMVLIDRSGSGNNKHIIGKSGKFRLEVKYYNSSAELRRMNGYRKYYLGESDCFGEFMERKLLPGGQIQNERQQREERSSENEMTMKNSIVLSKVMQKAMEIKAKLDSAVSSVASKVKQSVKVVQNTETEEQAEEESMEQEQEVVIVKDINEEQLDNLGSRRRRCKLTPEQFLESLKTKRKSEGSALLSQEIIDFFSLEFNSELHEDCVFTMIRKCSRFRDTMKDDLKKVIVAAIQNKKPDGLSINELEQLGKIASPWRAKKKEITRFRSQVKEFPFHCQTSQPTVDEKVVPEKISGLVKLSQVKLLPSKEGDLWHCEVNDKNSEIVKKFFADYETDNVEPDFLLTVFDTYTQLHNEYSTIFVPFKGKEFNWSDNKAGKEYKESFPAIDESVAKIMKVISEKKDWLNKVFKDYFIAMDQTPNSDQINNEIKNELQFRFGKIVKFNDSEKDNLEAAQFLIRFYWRMGKLIEFNKRLMIVNLLSQTEDVNIMKGYLDLSLHDLVKTIECHKIQMNSSDCQDSMRSQGFRSAAFRYLVSELEGMEIEIYGNESYGTVELIEEWKREGDAHVRLYYDGNQFSNIIADVDLRKLQAAREGEQWKDLFLENKERVEKNTDWDYRTVTSKAQFSRFFPQSFFESVVEWMDCYVTSTDDQLFLKMLHERFEVDGNHLGIADFQFVISTCILLHSLCEVSLDFLLNFASSIPQTQLVDNFFILRLESQLRTQLKTTPEILKTLEFVSNNRLKILLATKLDGRQISEEVLGKLLKMLRHTSTNNNQLENMSLNEWILTAEKQRYFDISDAMKSFGNLGYYITYLKQQDRSEAKALEKLLTSSGKEYHIPEKLIAQVCSLITHNEVTFDENYIRALDQVLTEVTEYSGLQKIGKHQFVVNESDQNQMLDKVKSSENFKFIISERVRSVDVISELTKGVSDKDDVEKRKQKNLAIEKQLLNSESETATLLNEIDDAIHKFYNKRLRDTQKMAIIYTVESNVNLLSQVNTGEGKSFIVASIAIIQARRYKFVDIITSSPVLAQRDCAEMTKLYEAMNLNVSHNCDEDTEKRKQSYKADVIYGEISRFQRDYLLHHFYRKNILGNRERDRSCVIVDEVDNMLLDNGNNMLYLSHSVPGLNLLEPLFVHLQKIICCPIIGGNKEEQFSTERIRAKILSDLVGRISKSDIESLTTNKNRLTASHSIWNQLIQEQIIDSEGYLLIDKNHYSEKKHIIDNILVSSTTELHAKKITTCIKAVLNRQREIKIPKYLIPFCVRHLTEYIENAKRALFMNHNEAYVVDVDHTGSDFDLTPKITIIDQNTGVDLATSQWSEGLHQCIQIKHACRLSAISLKAVFISNVYYLKGYKKINGLSGTLGSKEESNTLVELYKADMIKIPTFKAKRFYEHVPVITKNEQEWINAIFEEIADQVMAKRSVLIICQSIAEVARLKHGLVKKLEEKPSNMISTCYSNMRIYQREHEDFDCSALGTGNLIIATNLAGRGTDIKLSEELREAGGLHVIVAFLPENSRIEDQAYGRAARAGDLGSGQIIAVTEKTDNNGQPPSVFDLKIFRDNAEVQRLHSMTSYYNFHTRIEEDCLKAFKKHCLAALRNMNQNKSTKEGMPTETEIIYFALLDEWALWLDSQVANIKQCARDRSEKQRREITISVKSFLAEHPIEPVEKAIQWIKCPQPLLALGIMHMDREQEDKAIEIFDRVISDFPEFAGDACYYKGLIRQYYVRKVKDIPEFLSFAGDWMQKIKDKADEAMPEKLKRAYEKVSKITEVVGDINTAKEFVGKVNETIKEKFKDAKHSVKDYMPDSICMIDEERRIETEDLFLQKAVGPRVLSSKGFKNQTDETQEVQDCLSTSLFNMMGHNVSYLTFAKGSTLEEKWKGQEKFLMYLQEGYVSEQTVNNYILDEQCEEIRSQYLLSPTKLKRVFKDMVTEENRLVFHGRTVFNKEMVRMKCKLPSREEFWGFLIAHQCLDSVKKFYVLLISPADGKIEELSSLKPIKLPLHEKYRVQLSDYDLSTETLYDSDQVNEAFKWNPDKLAWLISIETLVPDTIATVNMEKYLNATFLPNYDYFLEEDLADWLEVSPEEAKWIGTTLVNSGYIRVEKPIFTVISSEAMEIAESLQEMVGRMVKTKVVKNIDEVNKKTIGEFLENPASKIPVKAKGFNWQDSTLEKIHKTFTNYRIVVECPFLKKIDNISVDVVKELFNLKTESEGEEKIQQLLENKILSQYTKTFYFQQLSNIDCSCLPECLQEIVLNFLYQKFSYTFAYNALFKCLEASEKDPKAKTPIMLPREPYKALFKDLVRHGFVHDHRIELRNKEFLDKEEQEELKEVEDKIKPVLFTKSGSLLATKKFFQKEKLEAGSEVQNYAINTNRQVGEIGENHAWIFWLVLQIVWAVFMAQSIPGLVRLALKLTINIKSYFATAMLVVAAVGTMLYFIQTFKAKYITQTVFEEGNKQHTQLVAFHLENIRVNEKLRENSKLASVLSSSISDKLSSLFNSIDDIFNKASKPLAEKLNLPQLGPRKLERLAISSLTQPHNWRLVSEAIRDILHVIKPKIAAKYLKILEECKSTDGFNIEQAIERCEKVSHTLDIKLCKANEKMICSLLEKIIEDTVLTLQQSEESGEDPPPTELPESIREELSMEQDSGVEQDNDDDSEILLAKSSGNDMKFQKDELDGNSGNSDQREDAKLVYFNALVRQFKEVSKKEVYTQAVKPLLDLFTNFIDNDGFHSTQSEDFDKFLEADADSKYSIEERKKRVALYQSMPFVVNDLQDKLRIRYGQKQTDQLFETIIKYGHAMSPVAMKSLVKVLHRVLKEYIHDLDLLEVNFENEENLLFTSGADITNTNVKKCTLTLTLSHGHFYICQADTHKIFRDKKEFDYVGACVFESIAQQIPEATDISKIGKEAFRQLILENISLKSTSGSSISH